MRAGDNSGPASIRPSVTVVIATRNRRHLLPRALNSALHQEGVDLEVIVVDDGSTDGTAEFLGTVRDDRVEVIRHAERRGTSPAKNHGLSRAAGRWIAFLDDDDVWAPHKLAAQLDTAAAQPTAWVCAGAVTFSSELRPLSPWPVPPLSARDRLLVTNVIPGGGSATMADTEVVRDLGGLDPELAIMNDWDLWIRLSQVTPWAGVQRPLVGYSITPGALTQELHGLDREIAHVTAKHRHLRAERGVELTPQLRSRFRGQLHLAAGKRRGAFALGAAGWRQREWPVVAFAGAAAVSPRRLLALWDRRGNPWPAGWREEAETWLAAVRSDHCTE